MQFNPNFTFDEQIPADVENTESRSVPISIPNFVDTLIEKYRDTTETTENEVEFNHVQQFSYDEKEDVKYTDVIRDRKGQTSKKESEPDKYNFTRTVTKYKQVTSFMNLNLCKPLLMALTEMSLDKPTAIQCACIPVALLHQDICACARTGSGKTLAFLLPILERLIKKPASLNLSVTRALVISPTRELAVQIYNVCEKLVKYCPKIRIQLAAGGLDLHSQEASLRLNPDLVIATPGRLIDHLCNAPNFNLQHIDFLVLDEADKLLDEYFTEQVTEIVKLCSKQRQVLLFSATMTESVKELAVLSLRDPVQIFLNEVTCVAQRLRQEFIRIRPHRESDRQAIICAILIRSFRKSRTIVFMPTKKECHQMHILLGLLGLSVTELHGDLTQAQRLQALERFSQQENCQEDNSELPPVDVLLATDLASRGLDIPNVQTVINYNLPKTMKQYIHRVGRTARAMNTGCAVSLVVESDRKLLKQIMKEAPYPIKARAVPPEIIARYKEKIAKLQSIIENILLAEEEERELRAAQSQLVKAEQMASDLKSGKVPDPSTLRRKNWLAERKRQNKTIGPYAKGNQQKRAKK